MGCAHTEPKSPLIARWQPPVIHTIHFFVCCLVWVFVCWWGFFVVVLGVFLLLSKCNLSGLLQTSRTVLNILSKV